jgi:hypothetical protein
VALASGVVLPLLALLPFGWGYYLLYPGMLISSPFWPEGIHTRAGMRVGEIVAMVGIWWVGSMLAWAAVVFGVLTLVTREQRAA